MNSNKRSIFRIGSLSAIALSVLAAVFYAVAYSSDYDIELRHFSRGSVPAVIVAVLFGIVIAVVSASAILLRKSGTLKENEPNQIESYGLWLTSFIFIAFGMISIYYNTNTMTQGAVGIGVLASKVIAPLAILSCIPFILASTNLRGSNWHQLSTCFPILWGVALLFKYYFDLEDMPLNDPELALTILAISSLVVFFISESRSTFGINSPSVSFFGNCIAVCLGGSISTIRIILSLVTTHTIPSLMENIIFFIISALALIRLLMLEFKFKASSEDFDLYSEESTETITTDSEEADA